MSKKKKKKPVLDDAAKARIAARKERKNARRALRGLEPYDKAKRFNAAQIAERSRANEAILRDTAWIVVNVDNVTIAGLLPPNEAGLTQIVFNDGKRPDEAPFEAMHEALLWLYAEAYSLFPPLSVRCYQAMLNGEDPSPFMPRIPDVQVTARSELAENWLNSAREELIAQHRANTMDIDDVDLFYEFVADETMREEILERESNDDQD